MIISTDIEQWLKTSIGGIILLGAIGSLLAVAIGKILFATVTRILPAPYRAHRKQSRKQAFFMGYASATIHRDETGRMILALLTFRLARFIVALTLFIFSTVIVCNILISQAQIVLTISVFMVMVLAFLAIYWAYFEFEWIHRIYFWLWKKSVEAADESYRKRELRNDSDTAGQGVVRADES